MENLTLNDLELINQLSGRNYKGNRFLSQATESEYTQLRIIKSKLKTISTFFSNKYGDTYGPFTTGISTGNPIAIGGTRFNNVWSGLFKGAENKQYAAQISFVMNRQETCLNVGFYFGAASAHSLSYEQKKILENQLKDLGTNLSTSLINSPELRSKYESLFDNGFQAFASGNRLLPNEWIEHISNNPASCYITTKIAPNSLGVIENSIIDSVIAQVMFLMHAVEVHVEMEDQILNKPLSPEQRAKQAERRAIIGHNGELFVMESERNRLNHLGQDVVNYPKHVAIESMSYGYDILSLDENNQEIYIEVKTTTRTREDLQSKKFFISVNEVQKQREVPHLYKIYRVYDIDTNPTIEQLALEDGKLSPDGYIVEY